ncbi:putative ribonuclease H-like domain-containing protein [Tanacetum coccineum]
MCTQSVRDVDIYRVGVPSFALRNFDLEDIELESTNSGPTVKLPILKLGEYKMWVIRIRMRMALTVTKKSTPATATERTNKKKMSKLIGVKKTVGTSSSGQNLAFMTAPSSSSTNDANTACPQVSAASPSVNVASPQACTASVSDNTVYAFMVENPNGSNVLHQDLEQIHEDDLEAMDLKWQLFLLMECYNVTKLGHFARSAVAQEAINGQFRNQDNTRKQGNNEDTSKAMLAIDGVGFDWSDMAVEQVQTNMALMAFSDSESEKLKKYKRCFGISVAVPPHHSVNYKLDLKARFVLFWSDEFKSLIQEQVSQDKSIFVEGYGYNTSKSVSEVEPNKVRKNDGAPIIEVLGVRLMMRKQMSLSLSLEEKTCLFPTVLIDRERQYMMIKDLFTVVGLKAILTGNIAYLSVFQAVGWRLLLHLEEVSVLMDCAGTASPNEEDNTKEEPKVDLGNITNSYIVPTTPNTRIHKDHPIDNVIGEVQSIIEPTAFLKLYLFHPGCIGGNKIVFAFASFMGFLVYQNDGKECFLYGTIEKKSMLLNPPGFKISDRPDKSYKVSRHFTGLHSAPRSMDKYLAEILKKFNYFDVKSASTPVDLEKPLVKDGDADDVDVHLYRYMIGSLMYLTASRLDIMFAVCACARFPQVTPKTSHLLAVKRIFRYLKGKPTLGLWYSRDSLFKLVAYTDSDYAGATQDRKSTTRGCISKEVWTPRYLSLVVPLTKVGDEDVHKELGDRMERVATTASSSKVEQDSGLRLHLNNPFDHLSSRGYTLGSGGGQYGYYIKSGWNFGQPVDIKKQKECLGDYCFKEEDPEVRKEKMSRPTGLKRLRKVDMSKRVESFEDQESLGAPEDASKQGMSIEDIDVDVDVSLVDETQERQDDDLMFDNGVLEDDEMHLEAKVDGKEEQSTKPDDSTVGEVVTTASVDDSVVPTTIEEITLAQTLIQIKAAKPKVVTIAATTTTTTRPKDKGVLYRSQRKDQIALDEQIARDIQAKLDAELLEEQKLEGKQQEEANIALIESWENTQAMMEADRLLAERLQSKEREELTDEEKAKLFMELMEKRRKHFAALRAQEKRNIPPTKAQKRTQMSTYLKHMGGYTYKQLKGKSFDEIQKLFDKEMKRVNTFVAMGSEIQESKEKKE